MDIRLLDDDAKRQLDTVVERVRTSPHNLVSRGDREQVWDRHVVDSIALEAWIPRHARRILDIGSGGGFPGIVLAIIRPDLEVHLLDATRKKTLFLEELIAELGITSLVHTGRAEELADGPLARSFDVVTARAVARLPRLVSWLEPFIGEHGVILAVKGERWREELDEARGVIERLGLVVQGTPDDRPPGSLVGDPAGPKVVMLARAGVPTA